MDIRNCDFLCPHCNTCLSHAGEIILNTRRVNGEEGKIRLAATFGNYTYSHEPIAQFTPGEVVAFSCPNCARHVHSEKYKDYAVLKMHVSEKIIFDVLFSREAGKRRTYIVTEDGIESYSEK